MLLCHSWERRKGREGTRSGYIFVCPSSLGWPGLRIISSRTHAWIIFGENVTRKERLGGKNETKLFFGFLYQFDAKFGRNLLWRFPMFSNFEQIHQNIVALKFLKYGKWTSKSYFYSSVFWSKDTKTIVILYSREFFKSDVLCCFFNSIPQ